MSKVLNHDISEKDFRKKKQRGGERGILKCDAFASVSREGKVIAKISHQLPRP